MSPTAPAMSPVASSPFGDPAAIRCERAVAELRAYRGRVRALVCDFIERMPLTLPIDWQSPAWVILMGIEHERIHLETSSVLIRQLPLPWVQPQPYWPACTEARHRRDEVPTNGLLPVANTR